MSNKSPHTASEVVPHTPDHKTPGAPDYFICKIRHYGTSEYDHCVQHHAARVQVENGWSVLVHAQAREDTEPGPLPGPASILDPALYVDAGCDSDGTQMVYTPCLFCAVRYGQPHRDDCPGGPETHMTTPAPEGWAA